MSATRTCTLRRFVAIVAGLVVLCVLTPAATAMTVAQRKLAARSAYDQAERLREALNGRPAAERSRRDYGKVLDAYRKVYYTSPGSSKADSSVLAVAELLAEEGRNFDDPKLLQSAIKQYEFLRREYPGSKYRYGALYAIGEIYAEDLNDAKQARATFEEFLTRYPRHELASNAHDALAQMDAEAAKAKSSKTKKSTQQAKEPKAASETQGKDKDKDAEGVETRHAASPSAQPGRSNKNDEAAAAPPPKSDNYLPAPVRELADRATRVAEHTGDKGDKETTPAGPRTHEGPPRVTGIRHWSTPEYTRVAIDLEDEVKYESGRVPDPDRIFFDLQDTKLAPGLVGKEFDVEDGLLKKIRVAQYQRDQARVVLDVGDVADYQVFMLPNPYRLIIDIHGKQSANLAKNGAKSPAGSKAAAQASEVAAMAPPVATSTPASKNTKAKTESKADVKNADSGASTLASTAASSSLPGSSSVPAPKSNVPTSASAEKAQKSSDKAVQAPATSAKTDADASSHEAASIAVSTPAKATPAPKPPVEVAAVQPDADPDATDDSTPRRAPVEVVADDSMPHGKRLPPLPPAPVDSKHKSSKTSRASTASTIQVAQPTADGDRSLIRALGLKIGRIVVDAGHGGHDTGTVGPGGLEEKDLVLDVSLRLGRLLEQRMGADVVFTRDDDTFIPLETRTAIANREQADLFISVHANSSHDASARGVETYYLNFTSSPDALEVAARENAVSDTSIHELQDLVKKIALKEKIDESREFAADVQQSLKQGLSTRTSNMRDRGVKKAPFIVLIGANMPSILAEISFLSNPGDEHKLKTPEYRQKIAESLYRGVARYVSGLAGVKMANAGTKAAGQ